MEDGAAVVAALAQLEEVLARLRGTEEAAFGGGQATGGSTTDWSQYSSISILPIDVCRQGVRLDISNRICLLKGKGCRPKIGRWPKKCQARSSFSSFWFDQFELRQCFYARTSAACRCEAGARCHQTAPASPVHRLGFCFVAISTCPIHRPRYGARLGHRKGSCRPQFISREPVERLEGTRSHGDFLARSSEGLHAHT
jgi:hypothetical protein